MYSRLHGRIHDVSMDIIQQKLMAKHLGTLRQTAEATPSAAPVDLPEGIVDYQLQNETEYQRLQLSLSGAERKLKTAIKRFNAPHPKITEAETEQAAATAALDAYVLGRRPAIDAELREEQKKYATGQPLPGDEALVVEKIRFLETVKLGLEEELKTIKIEEESFGDAMVTRTELAEDNLDLERRVQSYEDRVYNLQIAVDTDPPPIEVTHKPELPRKPELSRKIKLATVSGLGICCGIIALSVWLELRLKRVDTVDEVESEVGMPVMGTIPRMPGWVVRNRSLKNDRGRKSYWQSVLTESVDSARTLLFRTAQSDGIRSVIIVSAVGGEGKTTLSCHLATSLARSGRTVALVDFDIRRPSVAKVFKLDNSPGVCDYLVGAASVDEILRPSALPGLTVAVAGQMTKETVATLSGSGVTKLIEELKQRFDFVIVDSSPILPVTDSLLVSQHVDAALFAIRRDVSRVAKVTAAAHRLTLLGVPLLGAVAIGLEDRTSTYGYGGGYGYRNYNYLKQPT